jgi:hypothetical protein
MGEVASAKALLHSVITSGPAQPAGADGASGSGLRAGGRAPKRARAAQDALGAAQDALAVAKGPLALRDTVIRCAARVST